MTLPKQIVRRARHRDESLGQSFVEFALLFPVLLLLVMVALDFGRIYLGYINLQQMARVAASYASEHASAWDLPGDTAIKDKYQAKIANEAALINCVPVTDVGGDFFAPEFPGGYDLGDPVQVQMDCNFDVLTPVISNILGNSITVSANQTYPVREGAVSNVAGGGAPTIPLPDADFIGSPQTGYSPLEVTFTDQSLGSPTRWTWTFGNGNAFTKGPHTRTYTCTGVPGTVCTYNVSLEVGNGGGFDTETRTDYITVTVPPDTGPVAEFEATPRSGSGPLDVDFEFIDVGTGAVYTNWEWDFDGDGLVDDTGEDVSHTYPSPGVYTVTLTVTDDAAVTNSQTKTAYIIVTERTCTVPDFANVWSDEAQSLWEDFGFTTTVDVLPGKNGQRYKIHNQSITGGTIDPQPDGCNSAITVGPR